MTTPHDIVREARALKGVAWKHCGRTPLGVDCIGLVVLVAARAGVSFDALGVRVPRRYGRIADPLLYRMVDEQCERSDVCAGAMALFRFPNDRCPRHFGIISDTGTIIHAEAVVHREVIEHGYQAHWLTDTHSVWRIPGVRYE